MHLLKYGVHVFSFFMKIRVTVYRHRDIKVELSPKTSFYRYPRF